MLQPTQNQMELRLMVSKSFFNVDSKNVSQKFLHRQSSVMKNHSQANDYVATSVVMLLSHLLYILRVKEKKNLFCGISLTKRAPFLNNYCFAVGTFIHIWTTKRHGMIMMDRSNFVLCWVHCVVKGQLNSEWIHEVIVSPKIPTKNFQDFYPTL